MDRRGGVRLRNPEIQRMQIAVQMRIAGSLNTALSSQNVVFHRYQDVA